MHKKNFSCLILCVEEVVQGRLLYYTACLLCLQTAPAQQQPPPQRGQQVRGRTGLSTWRGLLSDGLVLFVSRCTLTCTCTPPHLQQMVPSGSPQPGARRSHRQPRGPIGPLKPEQVAKLLSELDVVRRNIDIMSGLECEA